MERENMRIKDEPMFLLLSLSYMQAKEVGSFCVECFRSLQHCSRIVLFATKCNTCQITFETPPPPTYRECSCQYVNTTFALKWNKVQA